MDSSADKSTSLDYIRFSSPHVNARIIFHDDSDDKKLNLDMNSPKKEKPFKRTKKTFNKFNTLNRKVAKADHSTGDSQTHKKKIMKHRNKVNDGAKKSFNNRTAEADVNKSYSKSVERSKYPTVIKNDTKNNEKLKLSMRNSKPADLKVHQPGNTRTLGVSVIDSGARTSDGKHVNKKRKRVDFEDQKVKVKKISDKAIPYSSSSNGGKIASFGQGDTVNHDKLNHCHSSKKKRLYYLNNPTGKSKKVKTKTERHEMPKVEVPKLPEEFSSNWKKLLLTLPSSKKHSLKDKVKRKHAVDRVKDKKKGLPIVRKVKNGTDDDENKKSGKQRKDKTKMMKLPDKGSDGSIEDSHPSKPDIWFDDVDEILLDGLHAEPVLAAGDLKSETVAVKKKHQHDKPVTASNRATNPLVKPDSYLGVTKIVAIDCEMVGIGDRGQEDILARVSIINQFGQCIYDTFVKASEKVVDYRTHVSGVRPQDMAAGEDFKTVQKVVSDMLKGRLVVGHALQNDFKVLFLDHPRSMIRDTSRYRSFRQLFNGRIPALKKLSAKVLGVSVQEGEHSSVQDAQAAMRLYTMVRKDWEKDIKSRTRPLRKKKQ